MSDGNRGKFFALGLVAGIAIAFLFALWSFPWFSDPTYQPVKQQSQASEPDDKMERGPSEGYWWPEVSARDTYAQWAMVILALAATVISVWAIMLLRQTLTETGKTNKLLANQFVNEHKPKFELGQFTLDLEKWINPSSRTGRVWTFNTGGTAAVLNRTNIVFHAAKYPPSSEPFTGMENANPLGPIGKVFKAGGLETWKFDGRGFKGSSEDIQKALMGDDDMRFFVIGRIHFKNESGLDRHMLFCRVYDPESKRFIPTDDPDYEYHT